MTSKQLWENIKENENSSLSSAQKLSFLYHIKRLAETCDLKNDSSYALTLIKISKYEFSSNYDYNKSIKLTDSALKINNGIKVKPSLLINVMAYFSLGYFSQNLMLYKKALTYYDSGISFCKNFNDSVFYGINCYYNKATIYFTIGDYQKAVNECTLGISLAIIQKDTADYIALLNLRAQSQFFQNNFQNAINDVKVAIPIAQKTENTFELANSYKTLGYIHEKQNENDSAAFFFNKCLNTRLLKNDFYYIANDYTDLGNYYLNNLKNYQKAAQCYSKILAYSNKIDDPVARALIKATAYTNFGENSILQNKMKEAEFFLIEAFNSLHIYLQNDIIKNVSSAELNKCIHKDLITVLMNNKTNLLLQQFKNSHNKKYLSACIQSALVTDTLITQIRHEQLGEQSKLYWRNKTRDFYATAIEACYLDNKLSFAFFFMEKSQAVLLNDQLNELDASSHLSKTDADKQEDYEIQIIELEQKLALFPNTSAQYQPILLQLIGIRNKFEEYIKSLEQKYPAYYQYKYSDSVPSLTQLQSYLAKNHQSFVHYFLGDTATYIFGITPTSTKLIRLPQKEFNKDQLTQFLQLCSNKEELNNHYDLFATLSNSIYTTIFQPLNLPKGRAIICLDNIVIPFEALCTDAKGKNFLLNDYVFSYVYSARFLLKQFNNAPAKGNFLGFAPVSFASSLHVADLKNAADALHASASYYKTDRLLTRENASKSNFFKYASSYSILNIFSHARADTTDNEPVLFMQDSLIHLSELQLLNNPAAKLVLLSACQTNVGKAATGEGIYSLARGFAIAGIPSVAATLWNADEQTIYSISEKFNQYLSEGMNKDEALQKAKLYFIQNNNNSGKLLPYYWANMIVIGNTDAIKLQTPNNYWYWIIGVCFITVMIVLRWLYVKNKNKTISGVS